CLIFKKNLCFSYVVPKNKANVCVVIAWGFFCLRSHVVEIFDDNKLTELGFFSRFLSVIVHPVSDTEMAICITEQEMYVSCFHKKNACA
ncbi:hypothetical protein, partial [Vibrio alginolyticus]|uniref:hypothetical protein n=1 Tax=Vibrio alginolyticus TaxID=663 RepID=UPI001C3F1BCB